MQVTRVTIQANRKQHNNYIIMHAGNKGYKPISIQVTGVTSHLKATQCMHTDYKGYKPIANTGVAELGRQLPTQLCTA